MKIIITSPGQGRPGNPYCIPNELAQSHIDYWNFDLANPIRLCLSTTGEPMTVDFDGEEEYQDSWNNKDWRKTDKNDSDYLSSLAYSFRIIYRQTEAVIKVVKFCPRCDKNIDEIDINRFGECGYCNGIVEHRQTEAVRVEETRKEAQLESLKTERILCAAIHYDDGKVYPHQPCNIQTGLVMAGRRHHNCIINLSITLGDRYNKNLAARGAQGFITNTDRYVNRKEGFRIALAANQIIHKFYDANNADQILVSEDLY